MYAVAPKSLAARSLTREMPCQVTFVPLCVLKLLFIA